MFSDYSTRFCLSSRYIDHYLRVFGKRRRMVSRNSLNTLTDIVSEDPSDNGEWDDHLNNPLYHSPMIKLVLASCFRIRINYVDNYRIK